MLLKKTSHDIHKHLFKIPDKDFIAKQGLDASIEKFFKDFETNKLKLFLKSQKIPEQ